MRLKLVIIGLLVGIGAVKAQDDVTHVQKAPIQNAVNMYHQTLGSQAEVFYGADYTPYLFKMEGIPFFLSNTMFDGWAFYKGARYEGLRLQWDMHRDMVVVQNPFTSSRSVLHNEYLDSFQLGDDLFIHLKENRALNLYNSGFFQVLYRGAKVSVLALRRKQIREEIRDVTLYRIFDPYNSYYIFRNGKYYLVENKNDVTRVLGDKVEKKMREQDVRFRKDNFEYALYLAAQIYDQSSN